VINHSQSGYRDCREILRPIFQQIISDAVFLLEEKGSSTHISFTRPLLRKKRMRFDPSSFPPSLLLLLPNKRLDCIISVTKQYKRKELTGILSWYVVKMVRPRIRMKYRETDSNGSTHLSRLFMINGLSNSFHHENLSLVISHSFTSSSLLRSRWGDCINMSGRMLWLLAERPHSRPLD